MSTSFCRGNCPGILMEKTFQSSWRTSALAVSPSFAVRESPLSCFASAPMRQWRTSLPLCCTARGRFRNAIFVLFVTAPSSLLELLLLISRSARSARAVASCVGLAACALTCAAAPRLLPLTRHPLANSRCGKGKQRSGKSEKLHFKKSLRGEQRVFRNAISHKAHFRRE